VVCIHAGHSSLNSIHGDYIKWLLQCLLAVIDHLGGALMQQGIMLYNDHPMVSLLKDGHELEGCEATSDF
jgi:hypothetical protein